MLTDRAAVCQNWPHLTCGVHYTVFGSSQSGEQCVIHIRLHTTIPIMPVNWRKMLSPPFEVKLLFGVMSVLRGAHTVSCWPAAHLLCTYFTWLVATGCVCVCVFYWSRHSDIPVFAGFCLVFLSKLTWMQFILRYLLIFGSLVWIGPQKNKMKAFTRGIFLAHCAHSQVFSSLFSGEVASLLQYEVVLL